MYKRIFFAFAALLLSVSMWAQTGGVTGTVVNRSGRVPVTGAEVTLSFGGETVVTGQSGNDGKFLFEGIEDGIYQMTVKAAGFVPANVNVTVENGFVKDLMFVSLVAARNVVEADDSSFAEFDMDDSGYSDAPSILFSNDVYTDIVGFGFSAIRFKNRGYNNETQDVYLSGVKMNDAITGYSPYSLWSGLNEATRSKETTVGNEVSEYGAGGYNGVTNILATASSVRPGWRFSVLSNSAMYRLRLMATYASGELDNGWSYAFNVPEEELKEAVLDFIKKYGFLGFLPASEETTGLKVSITAISHIMQVLRRNSVMSTGSVSWLLLPLDREVRRMLPHRKSMTSWATTCTTRTGAIRAARCAMRVCARLMSRCSW